MANTLYCGNNLDVLRQHVDDECVDLVYLDPPFKSDQNYNILFEEHDGTKAAAQILAFEDTWEWNTDAAASYEEMVELGGKVSEVMRAFKTFLGPSDMMAYLAMMAPRLVELRRVLKRSGSIFLHCDPTASHYLKMLMDAVFRPENFRNDVIWKRAETVKGNFGQGSKFFDRNTDSLLFYAKAEGQFFQPQFKPYSEEYKKDFYKFTEEGTGRRYQLISMTGPELNRLTPRDEKGRLKHKLFQRLTDDVGHPKLREHLASVTSLMKASDSWDQFKMMLDRALPRYGDTPFLPFEG